MQKCRLRVTPESTEGADASGANATVNSEISSSARRRMEGGAEMATLAGRVEMYRRRTGTGMMLQSHSTF